MPKLRERLAQSSVLLVSFRLHLDNMFAVRCESDWYRADEVSSVEELPVG